MSSKQMAVMLVGFTVAAFLGLILGKLVSAYAIAPLGVPIAAGNPQSAGRKK